MWWTIYEELKGWQTGIGALLGFCALMAAALWNFHLNRVRDSKLRVEEERSVAAALYGEIVLLRIEVARLARDVASLENNPDRKIDKNFLEAHKLSEPMIYTALADKLGLLSADLVLPISQFHKNFQEAKNWLPLLVHDSERGYHYSVLHVLMPARDAVYDIQPTLRTIERMISVKVPADDPEFGLADAMIEVHEHTWSDTRRR